MAIQRECLGYIPTLPAQGGVGLWFDDELPKTEDTIAIVPGAVANAPEIDAVANRYIFSMSLMLGGIAGPGITGWQGDFEMAAASWTVAATGVAQPGDLQPLGQIGDSVVAGFEVIVSPVDPTPADFVAIEWINQDPGPSSPLVDAVAEVAGNSIRIEVPWDIVFP